MQFPSTVDVLKRIYILTHNFGVLAQKAKPANIKSIIYILPYLNSIAVKHAAQF